MNELPESIAGLPNLCGAEALIEEAKRARSRAALLAESRVDFGRGVHPPAPRRRHGAAGNI
jgi:hypothetical protein